jgi:TonB family protein
MISNHERRIRYAAAHVLLFVLAAVTVCSAQEERKAIQNPTPTYPALARQLHLSGVVKIRVVIAPDGQVKQPEVLGGHPLLADAALNALKRWKYAPTKTETTAELEFQFRP